MENTAPYPTQAEGRNGLFYWLFQLLILPSLLLQVNALLPAPLGDAGLNFLFYLLNFLAVFWIFRGFFRKSISKALHNPRSFFASLLIWLLIYRLSSGAVRIGVQAVDPGFANRNNDALVRMCQENLPLVAISTIALVPPVEECFYRELIFHSLYAKNRFAAFLLSAALFSAVHVIGFLGQYSPLGLMLAFVQYLPAGLCLAGCYLSADTLLAPILLHSLVNAVSVFGAGG